MSLFTLEHHNGNWGVRERTSEHGGHMTSWRGPDLLAALEEFANIMANPRCRECRKPLTFHWGEKVEKQMRAAELCYACLDWTEMAAEKGPHVVYADGIRYKIAPDQPKGYQGFLGHGGAEFRIRFHDGRVVVSHNLWTQGHVPDHFKARLPDNAVFLKRGMGGYIGCGSASFAPEGR